MIVIIVRRDDPQRVAIYGPEREKEREEERETGGSDRGSEDVCAIEEHCERCVVCNTEKDTQRRSRRRKCVFLGGEEECWVGDLIERVSERERERKKNNDLIFF